MKKQYRYILEPYNGPETRFICPGCNKPQKTFTRYIDTKTSTYVHEIVGRCDREDNCGYHYTPKEFFADTAFDGVLNNPKIIKSPLAKPLYQNAADSDKIDFIPIEKFLDSLIEYEHNCFVQYLVKLFGLNVAEDLVAKYFIGSSNRWDGATVFWQIDMDGNVHTGKIMLYYPQSGHRVKDDRKSYFSWVHSNLITDSRFSLRQCLFGEHLLQDYSKPVAIVESEKTAIIASAYIPEFTWVAVGGINNLNEKTCNVLKGRTVILFPDLNGFEKWQKKAKELSLITTFIVSDLLETKASENEKQMGLDIADYLTQYSLEEFLNYPQHDDVINP